MKYIANFIIYCGESSLGGKYPATSKKEMSISAESDLVAFRKACECMLRLSNEYLSDPCTGKTKVILNSLHHESGREVQQKEVIKELYVRKMGNEGLVDFLEGNNLTGGRAFVESSLEDKLLATALEKIA